MKLQVPNKPMF